jgi:hypothetical protein
MIKRIENNKKKHFNLFFFYIELVYFRAFIKKSLKKKC